MSALRSRYPGLRPFDIGEQDNFFGRQEEIEAICRLLDLDKLIVLHGPSGMGKSSLINAGILPALSQMRRWEVPYHIVPIRFTNYDPEFAKARFKGKGEGNPDADLVKDPIDRFISACVGTNPEWPEVIPMPKESFWIRTKQMLVEEGIRPLRVIFVLDQFEELFTYPEPRVDEFAEQLEELFHQVMPESVRRGLERKRIFDADAPSVQEPEEDEKLSKFLETIEEPLDVKILISMRSDKLHYLERLKPFLPEMMLNSFELRSFNPEQARRAIVEPALLEGSGYISPQFQIEESALNEIMGFLEDKLTRRVDPSQLQIVCQHMEQRMIKKDVQRN
ncbi:MAG: ATP-binding protein [Bacteroidota bacterium]